MPKVLNVLDHLVTIHPASMEVRAPNGTLVYRLTATNLLDELVIKHAERIIANSIVKTKPNQEPLCDSSYSSF